MQASEERQKKKQKRKAEEGQLYAKRQEMDKAKVGARSVPFQPLRPLASGRVGRLSSWPHLQSTASFIPIIDPWRSTRGQPVTSTCMMAKTWTSFRRSDIGSVGSSTSSCDTVHGPPNITSVILVVLLASSLACHGHVIHRFLEPRPASVSSYSNPKPVAAHTYANRSPTRSSAIHIYWARLICSSISLTSRYCSSTNIALRALTLLRTIQKARDPEYAAMLDAQPKPKGRGRKKAAAATYVAPYVTWEIYLQYLQGQGSAPPQIREGGG